VVERRVGGGGVKTNPGPASGPRAYARRGCGGGAGKRGCGVVEKEGEGAGGREGGRGGLYASGLYVAGERCASGLYVAGERCASDLYGARGRGRAPGRPRRSGAPRARARAPPRGARRHCARGVTGQRSTANGQRPNAKGQGPATPARTRRAASKAPRAHPGARGTCGPRRRSRRAAATVGSLEPPSHRGLPSWLRLPTRRHGPSARAGDCGARSVRRRSAPMRATQAPPARPPPRPRPGTVLGAVPRPSPRAGQRADRIRMRTNARATLAHRLAYGQSAALRTTRASARYAFARGWDAPSAPRPGTAGPQAARCDPPAPAETSGSRGAFEPAGSPPGGTLWALAVPRKGGEGCELVHPKGLRGLARW
jgi:hypothetical protein